MSEVPKDSAAVGADVSPEPELSAEALLAAADPRRSGSKQTAQRAIEILLARNEGFHQPSRTERRALAVAFAMKRKIIYGAAFDVVRLARPVDLNDPAQICANLDAIELLEVKSTNRPAVGSDFSGYFFALTTAELLVAQSLGAQFKFAFVNTITEDHIELSLREVFARSRGIYPTWSIRF